MPFKPDPEAPLDPKTEADLRALAELIIADAVMHVLGNHNADLEEDEREALARDVEAEVDAMFAASEPECPCDEGARHRCDAHKFARRFTR